MRINIFNELKEVVKAKEEFFANDICDKNLIKNDVEDTLIYLSENGLIEYCGEFVIFKIQKNR